MPCRPFGFVGVDVEPEVAGYGESFVGHLPAMAHIDIPERGLSGIVSVDNRLTIVHRGQKGGITGREPCSSRERPRLHRGGWR